MSRTHRLVDGAVPFSLKRDGLSKRTRFYRAHSPPLTSQLALSGNGDSLAVSMPFNGGHGDQSGKIQVYEWYNNDWTLLGDNDAMHGLNMYDTFALGDLTISTDGMTVSAGSYSKNYVLVFTLENGVWMLLGKVINGEIGEDFGCSVALSDNGRRIVIGAEDNSYGGLEKRGHAVAYDYDDLSKTWVMVGQSLYGENKWCRFGASVSISGNGKRIAAGGYGDSSNGQVYAGHVRVFDFDEGNSLWNQIDKDIDGDSAHDHSGWSVALSNDANYVAIGAPGYIFAGDSIGSARVFEVQC